MPLPMIKTHDGVLKNAIKTFSVFLYRTPVFVAVTSLFGPNSTKIIISQLILMEN